MVTRSTSICIERTDVHRLTGSIDSVTGGVLAVHDDNGTIADYQMNVEAAPVASSPVHNFTATYTCKGKTLHSKGEMQIASLGPSEPKKIVEIVFHTDARHPTAIFVAGPNPRPPPPPPPACNGATNQTACDAIQPRSGSGLACSWCRSNDGVHSLCFHHDKKPDAKAWACDQ